MTRHFIRDVTAVLVTAIVALPLVWWALSSITPNDALLDIQKFLTFDYSPTFAHFKLAIFGEAGTVFDSRQSLIDSMTVATLATAIALFVSLPAAYVLSRMEFKWRRFMLTAILMQRFVPATALIFPLVVAYNTFGLIDSRIGLAFAHAALCLPVATLLLKSFFDDVPREVSEAALIDGATTTQSFLRIAVPSIRGGIAAAAILCFILSWTEFLVSLFVTQNLRLVPVQAQIVSMNMWGLLSALTTTAMLPVFVFVLFTQKHIVRGLTMGLQK
jgi:multiple sugar transport system permease protein